MINVTMNNENVVYIPMLRRFIMECLFAVVSKVGSKFNNPVAGVAAMTVVVAVGGYVINKASKKGN